MSPIVKTTALAVKLSLILVGLACVIWWAILALSFAAYGLLGIVVFVLWSIALPTLIYGMIHSSHRRYNRECGHR